MAQVARTTITAVFTLKSVLSTGRAVRVRPIDTSGQRGRAACLAARSSTQRPGLAVDPMTSQPALPACGRQGAASITAADAAPGVRLLLVVAVALLDPQGRVLLAQRPPGKKLEGLWEFPGGKVDPGEAPEAALVRELQEELGITVQAVDLQPLSFASHSYDGFHLLMPTYTCTFWKGEPQGAEGQALTWATAQQLRDGAYAMPPADVPLLPVVIAAMEQRLQQQQHPAVV